MLLLFGFIPRPERNTQSATQMERGLTTNRDKDEVSKLYERMSTAFGWSTLEDLSICNNQTVCGGFRREHLFWCLVPGVRIWKAPFILLAYRVKLHSSIQREGGGVFVLRVKKLTYNHSLAKIHRQTRDPVWLKKISAGQRGRILGVNHHRPQPRREGKGQLNFRQPDSRRIEGMNWWDYLNKLR